VAAVAPGGAQRAADVAGSDDRDLDGELLSGSLKRYPPTKNTDDLGLHL